MGDSNRPQRWITLLVGAAVVLAVFLVALAVGLGDPEVSTAGHGVAGGTGQAAAVDRELVRIDAPAGVVPADPVASLSLRGRCVTMEDGLALPTGELTVTEIESGRVLCRRIAGEFELALDSGLRGSLLVEVRSAGRLALRGAIEVVGSLDLGTLRLRRGVLVRGRLLDARDRPVAGASVRLWEQGRVDTGRLLEATPDRAVTDSFGRFAVAGLVGVGSYRIALDSAPPLRSDAALVLDGKLAEVDLQLSCAAVETMDQLAGVVSSSNGQPLANALVQAYFGRRSIAAATTTVDGAFLLFRSELGRRDQPVRLTVLDRRVNQLHQPPGEFAWGRHDLRLVADGGHGLDILVRMPGGQAATEFQVQAIPLRGMRTSSDARFWGAGSLADGRLALRGLRHGPHLIVVHPRGVDATASQPSVPRQFEVLADQEQELRIDLQPAVLRTVRVQDLDGKPVVGSRVEFFVLRLAQQLRRVVHRSELRQFMQVNSSRGATAILVATGQSDARGLARLSWGGDHPVSVRVVGQHVTWLRDSVRLADHSGGLVVRVEPGARLHGRLGPAALLPFIHSSAMRGDLFLVSATEMGLPVAIGAAGEFDAVGLPPGSYEVFLRRRAARGVREMLPKPLAVVQLEEGRSHHLQPDLRGVIERAGVTGTLRDRNGPVAGVLVQLIYQNHRGVRCRAIQVETDLAGTFAVRGITARSYRLRVRRPGAPWQQLEGRVELSPGQLATVDKYLLGVRKD